MKVERNYVFPLHLKTGDILYDQKTGEEVPVKDISIYTSDTDPNYKRVSWVHAGGSIYNLEVLFKKFRNKNNNMLEIA